MSDSPNSQMQSPLETSSPDSISELFSRDSDTWTDGDVDRMVIHLRSTRKALGENQAPAKAAKATKAPKIAIDPAMSAADLLKDLGL